VHDLPQVFVEEKRSGNRQCADTELRPVGSVPSKARGRELSGVPRELREKRERRADALRHFGCGSGDWHRLDVPGWRRRAGRRQEERDARASREISVDVHERPVSRMPGDERSFASFR
jgi:hypothetical protein